jgi:hypothetical protein
MVVFPAISKPREEFSLQADKTICFQHVKPFDASTVYAIMVNIFFTVRGSAAALLLLAG